MARSLRAAEAPVGLEYVPEFVSREEEERLLDHVRELEFRSVVMHGVTAKRTTIHFGWDYGYESWKIEPAPAMPQWLEPLRARAAKLIDLESELLEEILVSRYPSGAGIGWHRDAPMFGAKVIGISLASDCVMRFRREAGETFEVWPQLLERRSAYVIGGQSQRLWQHSISATKGERYSITFRTLASRSGAV